MLIHPPSGRSLHSGQLERSLRLSDWSFYPFIALILIWFAWLIIGCVVGLVNLALMLAGKGFDFSAFMNRFAQYGYGAPVAVIFATAFLLQLISRLLWLAATDSFLNGLLAALAVFGRTATLLAVTFIWKKYSPGNDWLLFPAVIGCAAAAWLGLFGELFLVHRLGLQDTITSAHSAQATPKETSLNKDVGAWIENRFPKVHKAVTRLFIPVLLVVMGMANGKSFAQALLSCLVILVPMIQLLVLQPMSLTKFNSRARAATVQSDPLIRSASGSPD